MAGGTSKATDDKQKGTRPQLSAGGKLINLDDRVTVVGAKSKHLKKDEEYQVHPHVAERLIEAKQATAKK